MKETGIIMSGNHPKLILDGIKTMTRRVIKPQPTCHCDKPNWQGQIIEWIDYKYEGKQGWFCYTCGNGLKPIDEWSAHGILCPYGQVGDRLWVRETWAITKGSEFMTTDDIRGWDLTIVYKDGELETVNVSFYDYDKYRNKGNWQPSLFMPHLASRITLEITEVRVKRLQEISYEDAQAEGIGGAFIEGRARFASLWDSLNAKRGYSWKSNPWIWVIGFRRL